MRFLTRWLESLQLRSFIKEVQRNARGEHFGRRPDVIRPSGRHGWREGWLAAAYRPDADRVALRTL